MRSRTLSKTFFTILLVIIISASMIITSFAYDCNWRLYFNDGTTRNMSGNRKFTQYLSDSHIVYFEWSIDNSDPAIFTAGNMYTFDVVLLLEYPEINSFSSPGVYQSCVTELARTGFTNNWYAHYVFDAQNMDVLYSDGSGQTHSFSLGGIGTQSDYQYYVSSDECVVSYNGNFYNGGLNDFIHHPAGLSTQRLSIQQKVHFQFTTNDTIQGLELTWYPYNFGDLRQVEAISEWGGSFEASDMVVMDNSIAQAQVNILGSLNNVSGQVSALQSSMDSLLEQQDYYFDLLTADWERAIEWDEPYYDDVEGILPQIYLYLWDTYDEVSLISTRVNTTNTRLNTLNNNLTAQTTTINNLFNTRTSNFWTWLDSNFSTIHNDLLTTNQYLLDLKNGLGLNDTDTQAEIQSVSSQIASTEQSLTTITDTFVTVDSETYATVANFVDDLTFMDGTSLNAGWDIFNTVWTGFNFSIGTIGILTALLIYVIVTKVWGQLFFDE